MSDATTDLLARFEQIVARLEQQAGGPTAGTFAAVGADGYPEPVAAGELIEAAWGTAVSTKLDKIVQLTATVNALAARPAGVSAAGLSVSLAAGAVPVTNNASLATGGLNIIIAILTMNITAGPCNWVGELRRATDNSVLVTVYGGSPAATSGFYDTRSIIWADNAAAGTSGYYAAARTSTGSAATLAGSTFLQIHQIGGVAGGLAP